MSTSFETLLFLSVIVFAIGMAVLVLIKNYRATINRSFAVFLLGVAATVLGFFLLTRHFPFSVFDKIIHFGGLLLLLGLFIFSQVFPSGGPHFRKRWPLYIPFVIFAVCIPFNLLIRSAVFDPQGNLVPTNGPLLLPYMIFWGIYFLLSIFFLVRSYRQSAGMQRTQVRYLLAGISVFFCSLFVFDLLLPILGVSSLHFVGPLASLVFMWMAATAIIRHELFSIKIIVTEIAIFALWIFAFVQIIFADTANDRVASTSFFVVSIGIGFLLRLSLFKELAQKQALDEANHELSGANQRLTELSDLKTEFLSFASHQIASPLTAIAGYASMMESGSVGVISDKQKDIVQHMSAATKNLSKLVADFLNVSKIEQGGMHYEKSPFDLGALIEECMHDFSEQAVAKGLRLTYVTDKKGGYIHAGDKEKLRQVVHNIIDNAIKYTPEGNIVVRLSKNEFAGRLLLEIVDTGMGIIPEVGVQLFQKFRRGPYGRMVSSGSGIGLYLAKEIVEAHSGRIWFESAGAGKGSQFYITLPLSKK